MTDLKNSPEQPAR